ncbi:MAG TPA: formate--tetrahydrofolate ligase [Planctomycetes bacterium]|nr:formate--tetrahydrofolate ligase [Planctomycetota bacterium]
MELVLEKARAAGAAEAAVSDVHARGGEGGEELAHAVDRVAEAGRAAFQPLYDLELPLEERIRVLARTIYGADDIDLAEKARESLSRIEDWGFGGLPICMAKTHLSLSHDPKLKGAPKNYVFPVRDVRLSAGAGFVYPLAGDMMLMPGLGSRPALRGIDVDADGNIEGLF